MHTHKPLVGFSSDLLETTRCNCKILVFKCRSFAACMRVQPQHMHAKGLPTVVCAKMLQMMDSFAVADHTKGNSKVLDLPEFRSRVRGTVLLTQGVEGYRLIAGNSVTRSSCAFAVRL